MDYVEQSRRDCGNIHQSEVVLEGFQQVKMMPDEINYINVATIPTSESADL